VREFVSRHAKDVIGTLCGFDRLVFRGTLRLLAHRGGMMNYLGSVGVLLKDFAAHAQAMGERLKAASLAEAHRIGRPVRYLQSTAINKEEVARQIARTDGVEHGLICVLKAVEPCLSYEIVAKRRERVIDLEPRRRKCQHLYHYQNHPRFGFMHARIQTWFPFAIQVCINGREWLARMMDQAGLAYVRRDNCFVWLQDAAAAQRLMDQQLRTGWPEALDAIARRLNPAHAAMFAARPIAYYWTAYQSEWASDIVFRDAASLAQRYPRFVQHGLTTFFAADVMRFLGHNVPPSGRLPGNLKKDVVSDFKARPEGVRIKHRLGGNSIKMYDKQGSVLRIETTINDAADFKAYRKPEGKPQAPMSWHVMRKGVADLKRRADVSQAANERYLRALAAVNDTTSLGQLADHLCRPVRRNGRRFRALNPYAPADLDLLQAVSHGEFNINGLRNRDLRQMLFGDQPTCTQQRRRQAAAVSRKLALLRAHGLIRKVSGTHRYHLTIDGRTIVTALLTARNATTDALTRLAA
jgi:hypothetical protein